MDFDENYKVILRWWLFFSIALLGTLALLWTGMVSTVNRADVTKLSFLIFSLFAVFTVRTGLETYRLCNEEKFSEENIASYYKRNESGWFVSDIMMTLGMIGTVAGFIYMLSTTFAGMSLQDSASMQGVLAKMSLGMSTALYTTAAGLICSLLLKLQLFNLTSRLDYIVEIKGIKR